MASLRQLGEFSLIEKFAMRPLPDVLPAGTLGIGDDCAAMPQADGRMQLVTTDLLTEGVHFLRAAISPFELGFKSLAVNLSDIAAMGGKPSAAFLAIALPHDLSTEWVQQFFAGFHSLAEASGTVLLGGDTTAAQSSITISVTLLGMVAKEHMKLRSTAQVGDVLCCTGYIGDSAMGLRAILDAWPESKARRYFVTKHYQPEPQLAPGQWLAQQPGVHAMMDLSDGLASDLVRLSQASRCGAVLRCGELPLSPEFKEMAAALQIPAVEFATCGGEDYALLCSIAAADFPRIAQDYASIFAKPLSIIGEVRTQEEGLCFLNQAGEKWHPQSFAHF